MKNIFLFFFLISISSCDSVNEKSYKTIESSKVKKGPLGSVASSVLDSGLLHVNHSVSLHRGYKVKKKSLWRKYEDPKKALCSGVYCY